MKRIMKRSIVLWILTFAVLGGILYLGAKTVIFHEDWVQKPFNGHISEVGTIYDRKQNALAYSDDNGRNYSSDVLTREALLHVVGDETYSISTAVQSRYGAKLSKYNFFWGAGLPDSMRQSSDVTLTVDSDSCRAAYEAMNGHKGACVVYNYKTGEVLCDTSAPSYDPENRPEITEENEAEYDGVFLDNVVSSTYTPGSTFKIVTAAAAIENIPDIYTKKYTCMGSVEIDGNPINCTGFHGSQTLTEAFANSCNCAFAEIAMDVGEDKMKETAERLGFNNDGFSMSEIPLAESHYDATGMGNNSLAWSGIGQQEDMANPMLMAMICGSIANGGTAVSPYIVVDDGNLLDKLNITNNKGSDVTMMTSVSANKLKEMMHVAASEYAGYGVSLGGLSYCAKTGTAEVGNGRAATGWFVGFIDDPNRPYAFAAVVVEGDKGIDSAAPVVEAAIGALVN